ncbi:hypothetical protein AAFC00_006229 [Neodothiora populina]|uniref:Protein-S-isoprenylcysteine O-methyltransferase n=1 Tax=Neodothiora populina TaxID=2781224 RepID=A0ABR3P4H0_9PEZI
MSPPTAPLYHLFILANFYATLVHFPIPRAGLSSPQKAVTLFLLSLTSILLSFGPVIQNPPSAPTTIESSIFGKIGVFGLASSLLLFIWTAAVTGRGNLPCVFAKGGPTALVVSASSARKDAVIVRGGSYAWIRHPFYASEFLGFVGVLGATMGAVKPEAMARAYAGEDGGTIGFRVCAQIVVTVVLTVMLIGAAGAEERAILKGEGKDVAGVKEVYETYRREVKAKFVPGLF